MYDIEYDYLLEIDLNNKESVKDDYLYKLLKRWLDDKCYSDETFETNYEYISYILFSNI